MRPTDDQIPDWLRSQQGETFDVDAAWGRFADAHDLSETAAPARRLLATPWRIAAAAVIVVGAASAWWATRTTRGADQLIAATKNGERQTVTLADGSSATLNGGSRLVYSASRREALLEGEALFEIRHDAAHPFTLRAGRGVIRDVGTRFTVRAYETEVDVGVTEGAVAVSGNSASGVTLNAGQSASIDSAGKVRRGEDTIESLAGWVSGDLVLDNVTLAAAARELERTYGVRVLVSDSTLARRHVTARFHRETVTGALDGIALALGMIYEKRDSMYVIRARGGR